MRPRHRVCRDHPLARAGLPPPQRQSPRSGRSGRRRLDPRGPASRRRGGPSRDQPQPLDDEAAVRRGASRARRHRVLQPHGHRVLGPQPARLELPVAVLLRHLGGEPRGVGASDLVREPVPAGRALRAWRRRRGGLARRGDAPVHREQLRGTAHRRDRCARARQAPRADAVPAEERPPRDRRQQRTHVRTSTR